MTGARLEIPIDAAWIPTAQAFVEQCARRYGLDSEQAADLARSSGNLFEVLLRQEFHSQEPCLQISCRVIPGGLEFVMADQGLPFDSDMWTRPEVARRLHSLQQRVDHLEFANLGLQGKETRLRKYFAVVPEAEESPVEREPIPVKGIRPFEPADAAAVARCLWRTYGYSYSILDAVYIPERLIALNQQGLMQSLVALNEADEVVGHIALERDAPGDRLVTAGVAAVEPAYRSQGLGIELARRLHQLAIDQKVHQVLCYAVTSHPYSQRLVQSMNFRCCCLVLGASLFCFEGMQANTQQRESLVGYHLALEPSVRKLSQPLFAPNRHRAMLQTICTHLGLETTFESSASVELAPGESRLLLQESPPRKTAKIHVESYGASILERIRSHARYLRLQDYRCFHLTLPLYHPYTAHILRPLEKMGFFFSGLTFRRLGPCLLLQDLYGATVDYSQIQIEDEMGRELLGYVRYMEPEAV